MTWFDPIDKIAPKIAHKFIDQTLYAAEDTKENYHCFFCSKPILVVIAKKLIKEVNGLQKVYNTTSVQHSQYTSEELTITLQFN